MNDFILQLGHPKIIIDQSRYKRVKDIFVHLFRIEEEFSCLLWFEIPVRLRYYQDLYRSFDNILAMIWLMQRDAKGPAKVDLVTQLLKVHWDIYWEDEYLEIRSTFTAYESLYDSYAQALNKHPILQISKSAFLSEWKTLLHQIIVAFKTGEIEIEEGTERRKWELLQQVEQNIPNYGKLYTRSS